MVNLITPLRIFYYAPLTDIAQKILSDKNETSSIQQVNPYIGLNRWTARFKSQGLEGISKIDLLFTSDINIAERLDIVGSLADIQYGVATSTSYLLEFNTLQVSPPVFSGSDILSSFTSNTSIQKLRIRYLQHTGIYL